MIEVVEELSISRSPQEVWAVLAEFGGISRWASNVDHSCVVSEQDDCIGAVRRVQMGRNTLLERVVEWEPGHRLGYTITGLPPVVRSVTNTWQLDELGSATRVTLTSAVGVGSRPPQRVAGRAVGRVLAKASRRMLHGLDSYLEEIGS